MQIFLAILADFTYICPRIRNKSTMTEEQKDKLVVAICATIFFGGLVGFAFGLFVGAYLF